MFTKKFWLIIISIFIILNACLVVFSQPIASWGQKLLASRSKWYAVYLNNGSIYFGRIKSISADTIKLKDVFYLESADVQSDSALKGESVQVQPLGQKTYNLLKRGSIQPLTTDSVLFINRQTVLFWERLAPDSGMVEAINKSIGK